MWYPIKTSGFVRWWFPQYTWLGAKKSKPTVYLTFDDGPKPAITTWVLEQLANYQAKATFFCVGANVQKYPEVYQQVIDQGHKVGNHTFNHMNGWKASTSKYIDNVEQCAKVVNSKLFRPPYGRIWGKQAKILLDQGYDIVMWDIIAGDFDPKISGEKCLQNILKYCQDSSIIVLHDSTKAWERLEYVLPRLLDYCAKQGYSFSTL